MFKNITIINAGTVQAHQRWTVGQLYDNVNVIGTNGYLDMINRITAGSGHVCLSCYFSSIVSKFSFQGLDHWMECYMERKIRVVYYYESSWLPQLAHWWNWKCWSMYFPLSLSLTY